MRTISYKLDDLKKAIIRIGYVGENQHTQVRIDCKDLFKEYPDAAVSMAIVSPAGQSYPKVVTVDGSTVVWDVTDSDLAAEGDGEIQLTFTEGGVVAKTAVARFNVYRSIAAEGPAPDPLDDWLQEASEALEDIEAAEVNQPIIGQDGYWYTWDQEAGEYVKTNTKAQGEDGQPGHTPEKGVDYWTAADKAEMESDVAGAIIDDTSTALDKTWSASKSNTLLSALDGKYAKPSGGIPASDMASAVQTSLGKADTAYQKPQTGIPASDLANGTIPILHNVPAGGSTGQYLKKASGTDYDLEWASGAAPTDEQVNQAVSDWLDDHPDATTTVENGAVSRIKLDADLKEKTDAAKKSVSYFGKIGKTAEAFATNEIARPSKITFNGNQYAFTNCRFANRFNYMPREAGSNTSDGLPWSKNSYGFMTMTGTSSSSGDISYIWKDVSIPAGTYRLYIDIDPGQSTISNSATYKIRWWYKDDSTEHNSTISLSDTSGYIDVTFENPVSSINVRTGKNKNNVYSNFVVWYGLYANDVTIIDTENTVSDGDSYTYTITNPELFCIIDTMQHKGTVEYVTSGEQSNAFVTPEMFGASGNGNADDTIPLQKCIDYAIENSIDVVGTGEYRITDSIVINGESGKFYFNMLRAWSNTLASYTLIVKGSYNRINIGRINSEYGILITSTSSISTQGNIIDVRKMTIQLGDAITLEGADTYVSYNKFFLGEITARVGNCVNNKGFATENWFYGGMMICPEGWAFYNPRGIKCYNASFESNCYGAIYMSYGTCGTFIGCRNTELTDKIARRETGGQNVPAGGTLIKLVGAYISFVYIGSDSIPYEAIDTSEATDVTDPTFDDDPDYDWRPDWRRSSTMANIGRVIGRISLGHDNSKGGNATLGNEMIVFNGRKVCKPNRKAVCTIEKADFDMRDIYGSQAHNFPYATKYRINVANCVIHLATSYCCEGYNELIIDQSDPTKLCTIYKSSDSVTPIFDGQAEGAGIYKLSCECDYSLTADMLPSDWTKPTYYYNGYNDVWTVEKLS